MKMGLRWRKQWLLASCVLIGQGALAQALPQTAASSGAQSKPGCSDIALPRIALRPALSVPRPAVLPAAPASGAKASAPASTSAPPASSPGTGQLAQLCSQYRAQCGKEHPACG